MSREKRDTRTAILSATWKLLETGQANSVRMADIAKRARISRQALYLHFKTRSDLLIATTHHIDQVNGVDERLAASRSATSGPERLNAYIDAWGGYIPQIHGVTKALLAVQDTDEAAAAAWNDRNQAIRQGCAAAIKALDDDGLLSSELNQDKATDVLWVLLSVRNWEALTHDCGWSQQDYIASMKQQACAILSGKCSWPNSSPAP